MEELMLPDGKANDLKQAIDGFDAPDLSKEQYSEHYANAIANGLEATRLVTVVETQSAVGQAHLMCRVKTELEREFVHGPVTAMARRLSGIAQTFFGKEFFLKGDPPKNPVVPVVPDTKELSPSEYAAILSEVVDGTGLAEVVERRDAPGQVHLMVRVKRENERAFVHGPVKGMLLLLKGKADSFFGKEFFLKNDQMVYAWNISIGSDDLRKTSYLTAYALQNYESIFQPDDPKLVYAWVASFGAEDLGPVVRSVSEALDGFGPRLIVTESPLMGPGTPVGKLGAARGMAGTKGASPIRG